MFKKMFCVIVLFCCVATAPNAQFYKSILPSAEFSNALEKVVLDFKYNYKNISGSSLVSEGEYDTYESLVKLPGASNCIIYKFHSVKDTTASWQGVMYQGDDYDEAVKVYRNTFRLLNKSRLQLVDKSVAGLNGTLQQPTENLRFCVSTLQLNVDDLRYKRFVSDVELVTSYKGFQVNVNCYNRKPDDEKE